MVMASIKKEQARISVLALALFCLGSFLLFLPMIGRRFVSDDFVIMERVMKAGFRTPGFLRPLSDLSLYLNFLLGELHPAGYYLFNIMVHGINSWLVWRFCRKWPFDSWAGDAGMQRNYAVLAALLFLAYPFHNEGIVWVLGRGASLATLFGLAVLVIVADGSAAAGIAGGKHPGAAGVEQGVETLVTGKKIIWAAVLYFIGMMAYESVVLLPLICFVILVARGASRQEMMRWAGALGLALIAVLTLRIIVAGGILGEYGNGFFGSGWLRYLKNFGDVGVRLFLPPTEDRRVMEYETAALIVLCLVSLRLFYRRTADLPKYGNYLGWLTLMLMVAGILPVVAAVSSRTSESDRLLYFPSVFLCCIIAYLVVVLCRTKRWLLVVSALLLGYMVFYLEKNNGNWLRASAIVQDVLNVTAVQPKGARIFVVNLPDENNGAYIFRHGFREAVLLEGRDTAGLVVVNHLTREQWLSTPDSIAMEWTGGEMHIAPGVTIRHLGKDSLQLEYNQGPIPERGGAQRFWQLGTNDRILYWNKRRLVRVLFF
jgi:protein O-mannosyl-transferase